MATPPPTGSTLLLRFLFWLFRRPCRVIKTSISTACMNYICFSNYLINFVATVWAWR